MSELEKLKEDEWYKTRPEIIKQIIDKYDPTILWKFKSSGKQCYIYAYNEPKSGKLEDITLEVQKTGVGGILDQMGLGVLDTNMVEGVKPEDLEPWELLN